ncbi:Hypothetical_protein [Hexamita inflata]|uniref:Hypothetical_protein n=1 Tax=Hexamita inflata TaxID=28002 RepID=A0AA86U512_9EUKA|nr:Hypothetical protein HINF_LOCUS25817 [Hexamita inflata]
MYQDLQLNGDEYTLELYINKSKKVLMRIQQQEEARILREQEFEYKKQLEQQRQAAVQQQYIEQEQQAQQEAQNIQAQQESDLQKQEDLWRTTSMRIPNDNEHKKIINYNYDILQSKKGQKVKLSKMFKKKQLKAQQFMQGVQMLDEEIEELEESRLRMLLSVNKNEVKMSVQDLDNTTEGQFPKIVKRDPDEIALSDRSVIQGPLAVNELNNSEQPQIVKIDPTEQIANSDVQVIDSGTEQRLQAEQRRQEIINQPEQPSSWNFDTNQNNIPIIKNENQIQDNQIQTDPEQIYQEFNYIQDMLLQEQAENIRLNEQLQNDYKVQNIIQKAQYIISQIQQIQTEQDRDLFEQNNPDYKEFMNNFEEEDVNYYKNQIQEAEQRILDNKKQSEQQVQEQQMNEVPLDQAQVQQIYGEPKEIPIQQLAQTPNDEITEQYIKSINAEQFIKTVSQYIDDKAQYGKLVKIYHKKLREELDNLQSDDQKLQFLNNYNLTMPLFTTQISQQKRNYLQRKVSDVRIYLRNKGLIQ